MFPRETIEEGNFHRPSSRRALGRLCRSELALEDVRDPGGEGAGPGHALQILDGHV
jgi:hypothetical protein